jgi:Rieske Fe-S protein
MKRRTFLTTCAAGCAAATLPASVCAGLQPRYYSRALLVDARGAPLRTASIDARRNYIFHYPYASTPCFLLNLGRAVRASGSLKTADARSYDWPGGVGPTQSLVAYSAICAHKLSYPTREVSFISYRTAATTQSGLTEIIHCCSEHSQYDPANGARVVSGPAPQPLAAILLDYDAGRDTLHAVGTLGGEMFNEFFAKFAFRLALDNGGRDALQPTGPQAQVMALDNFCRQQIRC